MPKTSWILVNSDDAILGSNARIRSTITLSCDPSSNAALWAPSALCWLPILNASLLCLWYGVSIHGAQPWSTFPLLERTFLHPRLANPEHRCQVDYAPVLWHKCFTVIIVWMVMHQSSDLNTCVSRAVTRLLWNGRSADNRDQARISTLACCWTLCTVQDFNLWITAVVVRLAFRPGLIHQPQKFYTSLVLVNLDSSSNSLALILSQQAYLLA